jgi:hypothetical protein
MAIISIANPTKDIAGLYPFSLPIASVKKIAGLSPL